MVFSQLINLSLSIIVGIAMVCSALLAITGLPFAIICVVLGLIKKDQERKKYFKLALWGLAGVFTFIVVMIVYVLLNKLYSVLYGFPSII